jgi:hypothetical protein
MTIHHFTNYTMTMFCLWGLDVLIYEWIIMISLIGTGIGVNSCHIHSNVVILLTILITNMNVLPIYKMFAYSIKWKLVGKVCGNFHSNFKSSNMGK